MSGELKSKRGIKLDGQVLAVSSQFTTEISFKPEDFYQSQLKEMDSQLNLPEREEILKSWFREDTADFWRHDRMYELALGPLKTLLNSCWLTVGDGRFGLDSIRLKKRGYKSALPTDISGSLLKYSKSKSWIEDFRVENAERLSFDDESFDLVLCKESYHHFPRPYIALYEMLRVAKIGVVLIEPNDPSGDLWSRAKLVMKRMLGKSSHSDACMYEDSGNYVYSISQRELEKVALGLNLPLVALKGLNDCYVEGCEFEPANFKSRLFRKMKLSICFQDILSRLGIRKHALSAAIIFKSEPPAEVLNHLIKEDWNVRKLPRNPSIKSATENVGL